ncbi:glutamate--tRNA ligase family protein [Mucilaginibacter sabulilitoris]|uniref:Glutamate--tRNA ligase family protein n=1 Tax=Mucilaginibacter sabulilitoris TaxID=1173583 RepID=A0ABZ0TRG3_9SPHI|nr:glutamate--tRNA ligase family protein [Mucilaginibacter sabulilitoris]WPU94070.1 glutamate--tRNA ligase family protein [Mucilaginibacter sabulilitoris]
MISNITSYHKTRIAPTPSGYLHLGNVLSFVITTGIARKHGARILLRIDDLDRARVNKQYLQDIFDTLHFLEIPWDEGPRDVHDFESNYSQLHRMPLYQEAFKQLYDDGLVFACTCSRKQLADAEFNRHCACFNRKMPLTAENASWRLVTNANPIMVKDYSHQIIESVLPADMYNFIVKKKDGFPAYQLASLIDDDFYKIDLIVRGEDLWPSTLAQHQLSSALGLNNFKEIAFYHHPLLTETSGQKLSKSAGATSVRYLRENGKTPAAIYTLIAGMLGIDENITNWQQLAGVIIPDIT